MVDVSKATDILGEKRVVSAKKAASIWNRIISERRTLKFFIPVEAEKNPDVPFSEEELDALKEDEHWFLVYNPGLSLVDCFAILGSNNFLKPYFGKKADWWLAKRIEKWALKEFRVKYDLIRAKALFPNRSIKEQKRLISDRFTRASLQTLVNAYVSFWGTWGDSPLDKYSHFGIEEDRDCMQMVLTFFKGRISISQWPSCGNAARLGAYVVL